VTHITLYVTF